MKEYVVQAIAQETIDVFDDLKCLELVRCKDCKAWKRYDNLDFGSCELFPEYNKLGDWFCNFGDRRECDVRS